MRRVLAIGSASLALSGSPTAVAQNVAAGGGPAPPPPTCPVSPLWFWSDALPQSPGSGSGDLWALFFTVGRRDWEDLAAPVFRAAAGRPFKIAWSMNGDGPLQLVATTETGEMVEPQAPPSMHGGPWRGEEWGSGFVFPHAGCWRLTATRGGMSGHIDIEVT
jgi:hypothetical protein